MAVLLLYSSIWLIFLFRRPALSSLKLWIVLWIGTRAFCFVGAPFYENDYYRYIWDGLVTLNGQNPLVIAPLEVKEESPTFGLGLEQHLDRQMLIDERLEVLPESQRLELLNKINFSESPSIYGPSGQIFLAVQSVPLWLYQKVYPEKNIPLSWRINVLRCFFLLIDFLSCCLLLKCLKLFDKPLSWLYLYLLCPVLLKEVGNSLHIDLLSSLFVFFSFILLSQRKFFSSAIFLALGTGVKMYALVLFPFYILWSRSFKLFLGYLLTLFLLYFPFVLSGGHEIWVGTQYFSNLWSMNDFFPALLREILYSTIENKWSPVEAYPIGVYERSQVQMLSRQISLACFVVFFLFHFFKSIKKNLSVLEQSTVVSWMVFAVFWFSPVQNPWYYLWGLPFFILSERKVILLMVGLSQLYLFNFHLEPTSHMFEPMQWWVIVPHVLAAGTWVYFRWKKERTHLSQGALSL